MYKNLIVAIRSKMALRLGTQIFAVVNIIASVVICLLITYSLIAGVLSLPLGSQFSLLSPEAMSRMDLQFVIYYALGELLLMMLSYTTVVFASVLVNGAFKGKPEHIKLYFVYGSLITVLFSILNLICLVIWPDEIFSTGLVFCVLFIYSLILVMIYNTYKKMEIKNAQYKKMEIINAQYMKMEINNAQYKHQLLPEKF